MAEEAKPAIIIKDRTDRWMQFLEERMYVIQGCLLEGYTVEEVEQLINISGMQSHLLCMEAQKRNDAQNSQG